LLRSRGLDIVLGTLDALGYDAEWHCIPASAIGAPHQRDRIWVVAHDPRQRRGSWGQMRPTSSRAWEREYALQKLGDSNIPGLEGQSRDVGVATGWTESLGHTASTGVPSSATDAGSRRCGPSEESLLAGRYRFEYSNWWATEPDVGRVAHGVSNRVDRLRALGNSVVPQIPEMIGRAIIEMSES
jgi:DNA (cytosine-5)-methyltransferase 1